MKKIIHILLFMVIAGILLVSCGEMPVYPGPGALSEDEIAAKQKKSLKDGHVYIYDGSKLHDLMELEYVMPAMSPIDDMEHKPFSDRLSSVLEDPNAFIISFTVVGYTEQLSDGEEYSTDYMDYIRFTNLRIDAIHYMGENVDLEEGKTYCFLHAGAWVLKEDNKYVYSVRPRYQDVYGVLRYNHQYVMSGYWNAEVGKISVNNNVGWNEICSDEENQIFYEQYPRMTAYHVTTADQLFEPGFRD